MTAADLNTPLGQAFERWRNAPESAEELRARIQSLVAELQRHADDGTPAPAELVGRYLRVCNRLAEVQR